MRTKQNLTPELPKSGIRDYLARLSVVGYTVVTAYFVCLPLVIGLSDSYPVAGSLISGALCCGIFAIVAKSLKKKGNLEIDWFVSGFKGLLTAFIGIGGVLLIFLGLSLKFFPQYWLSIDDDLPMMIALILALIFWLAWITTFTCWTAMIFAECVLYLRLRRIGSVLSSVALTVFCLFMQMLFTWLSIDTINESVTKISTNVRYTALIIFAAATLLGAFYLGVTEDPQHLADEED